jgi:hypothetical protein
MAQYTILSLTGTDTITLTDGTSTFRVQVRSTDLCFDQAITASGFSGVENTDWVNLSISTLGTGQAEFRVGARSTAWIVDQAITAGLGFDGVENTDWSNIEQHNL